MATQTSETLLERVRDAADNEAWTRFYSLYAPLIAAFSRQKGCSESMTGDVLQETMVRLAKVMPRFRYDREKGQFRSYLLKVVHDRIRDAFRRENWRRRCQLSPEPELIAGTEATHGKMPGREWGEMWDLNLLAYALDRVRARIEPLTYRSFEMYVMQENPVEAVQRKLGIRDRNLVYQHKNRVIRLLRREIASLEEDVGL